MKRRVPARRFRQSAIVGTVLLLCALPGMLVLAQAEETRYFEETGHNVSGDFLQFYDAHGGLAIFGYPLSRRFQEGDRWVQYFQRARMESHPDDPGPYHVQLGLLGEELGYRQSPIPEGEIPPPEHPDKRYFPETGHTAAFAFLDFWEDNGGVETFGYPITEWIIEPDGRIVQYFQRAKMEWYPENPAGKRVQLGMLGTIYVEQFVDPIYREREDPRFSLQSAPVEKAPAEEWLTISPEVTDMRLMVTLKNPIIGLRGTQTAYVYVFDQNSHGVPGAVVEMDVRHRDGRTDHYALEPTNANGYTQIEFGIGDASPGYVVIADLTARYQDVLARTSSAFLPWW